MVHRYPLVRPGVQLVLALALAACSSSDRAPTTTAAADDPVVATYSGGEIRRSEVAENLANRLSRASTAPEVEARRAQVRALAGRQARIGVLYQQALAAAMKQRPDVAPRISARQDMALAQAWLEQESRSKSAVSDQAIDAELARRLPKAARPETRSFSHIFLRASTPQELAVARKTAADIRRRLDAGETFAALAREYSDSLTARAGGSVSLVRRDALSEDLGKLIFGMTEGAVSEPTVTRTGLHLFRLDAIAPGTPADAAALRASIAGELRHEAEAAADSTARQLAIDEAGVDVAKIAQSAESDCSNGDHVLATVAGQPLTCKGFTVLYSKWPDLQLRTKQAALSWLISNRVLAQRMIDQRTHDNPGKVAELIAQAEHNELVAARRDEMLEAIDVSATAEELAARRQQLGMAAPELHEFVVDLLFFEQSGNDVETPNGKGERIADQLRKGADFSRLLDAATGQPGTRVFRDQGGLTYAELSQDQPQLRDELLRLATGEVSVALQLAGNRIRANGKTLIEGKGLLFARKREERVLALDAAEGFLRKTIANEKLEKGKDAIKSELDKLADLRIVLQDG